MKHNRSSIDADHKPADVIGPSTPSRHKMLEAVGEHDRLQRIPSPSNTPEIVMPQHSGTRSHSSPRTARLFLRVLSIGALAVWSPSCTPLRPAESETAPTDFEALPPSARAEARTGNVSFPRHVKPILDAKCVMCHGAVDAQGGFRLDRRRFAFSEGIRGRRIVPFDPHHSPIISRLDAVHAGVNVMPPVGNRFTRDEQAILRRWIAQGASWPEP